MKCLNMNIIHCVLIIIIIIILLIKYFISTKTKEGFAGASTALAILSITDETKIKNDARCYYENNTDIQTSAGNNPDNKEWLMGHYINYGRREGRKWGCTVSHWALKTTEGLANTKCNNEKANLTDAATAAATKCNEAKKAATADATADATAAAAAVTDLESKNADLESNNADLEKEKNAATADATAAAAAVTDLESKNAQLTTQNNNLEEDKEQLKTQNNNLEEENALLPKKIDDAIQSRIETSRDIYLKVPLVKDIDDHIIDISTVQCVDNKMAPVACPSWWILS
jgi:hypothetical protein